MKLYVQSLLFILFIIDILSNYQFRAAKLTFKEFIGDSQFEINKLQQKFMRNQMQNSNIAIEMNDIGNLLSQNSFNSDSIHKMDFNDLLSTDLSFKHDKLKYNYTSQELDTIYNNPQKNLQHKQIVLFNQNQIKDALDDPNIDTSIKRSEAENPLEESKKAPSPLDISDPSDQQLQNMKRAQMIDPPKSPETQQPMETKKQEQVYGLDSDELNDNVNGKDGGKDKDQDKEQGDQSKLHEESTPQKSLKLDEDEENQKDKQKKDLTQGCDIQADDGIMNCENGKNQIRIDDINQETINDQVEDLPQYEISLYYGLVLCCLIILVLLLARLRVALSRYLDKYYIKSLRIIVLDVIILISLNTLVQIMYYNRVLDVIQLKYFNIYGFTITLSFFSISWIFMATLYAFILQKFSNSYMVFESYWPHRNDFIEEPDQEETETEYEERVSKIQYCLMKEDFIMPVTHICYTEPMVLRQDFNFAEYLGRAQAKCHLLLFNISFTTLFVLILFFLLVCFIDMIENNLIECIVFLIFPLLTLMCAWQQNRRQFLIISQLLTVAIHQFEIESVKFLHLDTRNPIQFANKLRYPWYIMNSFDYTQKGVSRHLSLFPFEAVEFPLKAIHFIIVLNIVWIMVYLFNYSNYLVDSWECQLIFSIGLFLILFQLFFIVPFFLKKYAVNSNIQQLKDAEIIEKVVSNHKEQVTLSFQRFYRLLKHIRRFEVSQKNHIKLRPEIKKQLEEIDHINLASIDMLTRKLGFYNLKFDELYYLGKAFTDVKQLKSDSSEQLNEQRTNHNVGIGDNYQQNEERPTANPRSQINFKESRQEDQYQERKDEEDQDLTNKNLDSKNTFKKAESLLRSDYDSQIDKVNKKQHFQASQGHNKSKFASNEIKSEEADHQSSEEKQDSQDSEVLFTPKEKVSEKELSEKLKQEEDKKEEEEHKEEEDSHQLDRSGEMFDINKLQRICSIFTQEVVLEPYNASIETLHILFPGKDFLFLKEFKDVIDYRCKLIEKKEELNLIIHNDDIKAVFAEIKYLEDKYQQISFDRIASLIRNSIEMLPR